MGNKQQAMGASHYNTEPDDVDRLRQVLEAPHCLTADDHNRTDLRILMAENGRRQTGAGAKE